MDVSFEPTMAGGEWGGDVGNISMTQAPQVAAHIEKIPLPVALKELEGLVTDDDKFHIGNYGFTNLRTCGRVETIEDAPTGERTVTLNDPTDAVDIKFKTVVYETVQQRAEPYAEGDVVVVVGKIRMFDNELSMLVFDIQVIADVKRVETFLMEAELAKCYYGNNVPDKISNGVAVDLIDTIFSNQPVESRSKNSAGNTQPATSGFQGVPATPNSRGLTGTKAKIHNFIQRCKAESGVNIDDIRREVGDVANFDNELQFLVNEGMIYSTIDDFHFSAL